MSLFSNEEDLQYFKEKEKEVIKGKNKYCDYTIRLLSEAHEIYVPKKQKIYQFSEQCSLVASHVRGVMASVQI